MMSRVPRKSREVHAQRIAPLRPMSARYLLGVEDDEPHTPGRAECVCEEPCRYCRCEPAGD